MGYNHSRYARKVGADIIYRDNGITYPNVKLYSTGIMAFNLGPSPDYLNINQAGLQISQLTYAANVSTLAGGGVTGDDLELKANTIDAAPTITLEGNGDIVLGPPAGSVVKFGQYTGGAAGASAGYITVKDIAGNTRKLMVQA